MHHDRSNTANTSRAFATHLRHALAATLALLSDRGLLWVCCGATLPGIRHAAWLLQKRSCDLCLTVLPACPVRLENRFITIYLWKVMSPWPNHSPFRGAHGEKKRKVGLKKSAPPQTTHPPCTSAHDQLLAVPKQGPLNVITEKPSSWKRQQRALRHSNHVIFIGRYTRV